jgi:hypothetical protein
MKDMVAPENWKTFKSMYDILAGVKDMVSQEKLPGVCKIIDIRGTTPRCKRCGIAGPIPPKKYYHSDQFPV